MISFNKPYFTEKEFENVNSSLESRLVSGDQHYTKKCHKFIEKTFTTSKALLTTSCSMSLDMASILLDLIFKYVCPGMSRRTCAPPQRRLFCRNVCAACPSWFHRLRRGRTNVAPGPRPARRRAGSPAGLSAGKSFGRGRQ